MNSRSIPGAVPTAKAGAARPKRMPYLKRLLWLFGASDAGL
jgi:hypothetical protein